MKTLRRRHLIHLTIACFFIAAQFASGAGLVLCVGDDGHAAIEWQCENGRPGESDGDRQESEVLETDHGRRTSDCCGGHCLDIPISQIGVVSPNEDHGATIDDVAPVSITAPILISSSARAQAALPGPLIQYPNNQRAILSFTILLI